VGVVTSGMFGHRVGGSLGMGYVKRPHAITADWIAGTRFEIGVGDRRVAAQAQLGAWYDPQGHRIKA
jgi:glycine cleavage system aminomethyltransferase T